MFCQEICGGNYGSVWKEPSPESRRLSEMKEKKRRRSKMFNADELQQFRIAETPDRKSEVDRRSLLDFQNTSLSDVEGPRCPDSSVGQHESVGITPVIIEEEMISQHSERVTNDDKKERTPLSEPHPDDYSTPIAPPVLSDSLPYSPSQPFIADISQSPTISSLVSPNSPASDGEFFTPLSQIKSRVVRYSNKKIRTKLQPKQLSADYSDVGLKSNEHSNKGDSTCTSPKTHFMKVCKTLGEKLALLKKGSLLTDSTQNSFNDTDIDFENQLDDNKTNQTADVELNVSPRTVDSSPRITESLQKNREYNEQNIMLETENAELEKSLVEDRKENRGSDDLVPEGTSDVDASVFPSPEISCSDLTEENSPQAVQASDVEEKTENNSNVLKISLINSNADTKSKVKSAKRGRPRKLSQDDSTTIKTNMQRFSESVDHETSHSKIESNASVQERRNVCMVMEADCQINGIEIPTCNEFETHSAEVDESTSQKVKRKRGRPRKSLSSDDQSCALPVSCPSALPTDDASTTEDNNTQCEDGQSKEELIAEEKKSRRLRRRSFEIFRASREEPNETKEEEQTEQEEKKDFGSVLKDLNGSTAPVKAPRKRKKLESEEDIAKIYTAKNYLPPPLKALETISESPSLAKQARKLKRLIDFGSLYHIPQIKQRKRQQKAAKRGWDQKKVRKSKIPDDVVQQKLQSIWDELDTDKD